MPNYYNPYNFYPASYAPVVGQASFAPYSASPMPQAASMPQSQLRSMEWIDGEVSAKAYAMPPGWPANQPLPLWDSTDTVIYVKSWSPLGVPNPMQILRYTIETPGQTLATMPQTQSGSMEPAQSDYVTKADFDNMMNEFQNLKESMASMLSRRNQNGSNNNGQNNRGGGNNA